nr:uncharacterized protein LOC113821374 [Penaeus vannamei]
MKLNLEKCEFAKHQVKLLGFLIGRDGIRPVQDIRRFLGACGFFRRHIEGFATIARPLTRLTKKGVKFEWGVTPTAFDTLKKALVRAPILRLPDFSQPFEVHSDASLQALGAALLQRDAEGVPYAIAYWSRVLKEAETRYPTIDLEALAVVEAVRVFDPYIYGRHFTIWTDHQPLTHVFSRRTKSNRLSRYAHELGEYDFALRYKQGPSNLVPDLPSRLAGEPIPHMEICPIDHPDPDPEPKPPDQLEHHDPEPEPELPDYPEHDPEPEPEPPDQLEHHEPEPEPNPPDQPEDDPDLTTMDPRKMREQQIRDPTCNDLISWLEGHQALPQQRPPAIISSFEVEDGVLYHLREYSDRAVKQLYVPLHLQTQALHLAHCPPSATHPGALQTYQNLCNSWYFPNMLLQSREYVARCPVCQRRKGSAVRVPMQGHLPPEAPLVMVSADLMDLRSSSRGYQYVLSIIVTTPAFCSWSFFVTRQLKEFCQLSWITT